MRMKLKNLKKLVSVAIICTMTAALFVPTLSVQAAETQAMAQIVENYTDVENSEYKINSVGCEYGSVYVNYSVPTPCLMIMAEYNNETGLLNNISKSILSAETNATAYFSLYSYGNCNSTVKLFIVDGKYRPLGKAVSESFRLTYNSEEPSVGSGFDAEPHPTVPLKNDSGCFAYGAPWSVDTDGVLTIGNGYTYRFTTGKHTVPWDEYREAITSVVLSDNITDIGQYMFQGLSKVKEITIPANVCMYEKAFVDMTSLERVVLKSYTDTYGTYSAENIFGNTFINCPSLKEFVVDEDDSNYMTIDGVLYSKDGETLIKYPAGKTDKTFTIPDSVEYIDSYAFECASNLESIYNVPNAGEHTFANCTSLKNIEFSSEMKYLDISAFYNCISLTELNLPDTIEYIYSCYGYCDYDADCNDLDTTAIESINVPSSIRDASKFASVLPGKLNNIEVKEDDSNFKLVDGVLFSTDMTTLYRYIGGNERTSYTIPESVTSIESNAFKNCKNLKNIEIGSNVTSIGSNAFEGCANLTDINLTNVSCINSETFTNCINLKNVELGSAERISQRAFYGCKSLESITIPASVTNIDNGIFVNCDSLKNINVADGNQIYSVVNGCLYSGTELKEYPNAKSNTFVVPSDTTKIAESAFEGRKSLKSVTIPDSVEYIGASAFGECSNLKSVSLSAGLGYLETGVFYNCTSLSTINIPDNLDSIGAFAFANCKSLKTIEFPEAADREYSLYLNRCSLYNSGLESITIPGYVELDYMTFLSCYDLRTVKFESDHNCYNYETSQVFWNIDDITIYYPKDNENWTSSTIHNYYHKDAIKFVPYTNDFSDDSGNYTFTGLEPDSTYIVGISDGAVNSDLIDNSKILYLDQLNSDSNGNLTMNYTLKRHSENTVPFVLGAPKYGISNASIEVADIVYSGRAQDKPDNYTVIFDGKELTEGIDYLVTDGSGFDGSGTYSFSVVGIGNYYGTVSKDYKVLGTEYDVDGDGMITIRDTTAIQFYLAGIRNLNNPDAADANGDGEISVDDVTYIQKLLAGIC